MFLKSKLDCRTEQTDFMQKKWATLLKCVTVFLLRMVFCSLNFTKMQKNATEDFAKYIFNGQKQ